MLEIRGLRRLHGGPIDLLPAVGGVRSVSGRSGYGKSVLLQMIADWIRKTATPGWKASSAPSKSDRWYRAGRRDMAKCCQPVGHNSGQWH